ncbi:MAG: hypothetical protein ACR2PX_26345 [Endozoicomonas sp.]|uniref:hypothetical protein n=1 Tax=Endozoicomonas sp. TaxID=1892382 RepID=UPI003D9BE093
MPKITFYTGFAKKNLTDNKCEEFAAWAGEQLRQEFPNAEIFISDDIGFNAYDIEGEDPYLYKTEIGGFVERLYDRWCEHSYVAKS